MTTRRRLAIATGISFAGSIISALLGYPRNWIVARALGPKQLGIFTLAGTIAGLGSTFFGFGINVSITKYIVQYSTDDAHVRAGARWAMILGSIFGFAGWGLVITICIFVAKYVLHQPEIIPSLIIVTLSIPFTILLNIASGISLGKGDVKYQVLSNSIILPMIWTILVIFVWLGPKNLIAMSLTIPISTFIALACGVYFICTELGKGEAALPPNGISQILSIGFVIFISSLAYTIWLRMDVIALGMFWGPDQVGLYTPAFQTSYLLNYIITAVSSLFGPTVVAMLTSSKTPELNQLYKEMNRWCFLGNLPIAVTLFFGARPFLGIFGKSYISNDSILALRILLFCFLFYSLFGAIPSILLGLGGQQKKLAILELTMILIAIIMHMIFTKNIGVVGTAIASGSTLIIASIFRTVTVKCSFGFIGFDKSFWRELFIFPFVIFVVKLVNNIHLTNSLLHLFLLAIVSLLAEAIALYITGHPLAVEIYNEFIKIVLKIRKNKS